MALKPGSTTRSPSVPVSGHHKASPSTSLATNAPANPWTRPLKISTNQAAALLKRAGMPSSRIATGVAIGMAESGLDAHRTSPPNTDGSVDRGWAQINSKAWSSISDAKAYNPYGAALGMTEISNLGQNWHPWTTFQQGKHLPFMAAGRAAADYVNHLPAKGIDKVIGEIGGVIGGTASDIAHGAKEVLNFAEEMPRAVVKLIQTIVNPGILGKLLGEASVWILKTFGGAFYKFIILPPWHWTERATQYYWTNVILGSDTQQSGVDQYGLVITAFTWATGYAILFGKAEKPQSITAPARETPLARTYQSGVNAIARRSLTPPKEVEKKTPNKPKPAWSAAELDTIRMLSVERNRPVRVATTPTEQDVESRIEREEIKEITKEREREATKLARTEAKERIAAAKVAEAAGLTPAEYRPARVGPRTRSRTHPKDDSGQGKRNNR